MLSRWIPGLRFVPSAMFFAGMALVTISLFLLSLTSWPRNQLARRASGKKIQNDVFELAPVGASRRSEARR
jgi:hypothetical protein